MFGRRAFFVAGRAAWNLLPYYLCDLEKGGSVAEWLACWTRAQKGLGPNSSRNAVE